MRLEGTVIVVTGGASGLGLATARQLAAVGAHVVITDLQKSSGDEAAKQLGGMVTFVPADILDDRAMSMALDTAEGVGPIRGLVHCAGRGGDRNRILDKAGQPADLSSFMEVLRVNLGGTYNAIRLAAARMATNDPLERDRGAIVLTSSIAAFDGQIGQTAYVASKAAVHGMTLVAARDLAGRQIRVNSIAPGTFDTPMLGRLPQDRRDGLADAVPHPKRLGDPADYAHMALALLENSYINGETVRLDGAIRMPPR